MEIQGAELVALPKSLVSLQALEPRGGKSLRGRCKAVESTRELADATGRLYLSAAQAAAPCSQEVVLSAQDLTSGGQSASQLAGVHW